MIEKYYKCSHNTFLSFDVVQFVKEHRDHVTTYNNLSSELADIEKLPTLQLDQDRVQTSKVSDPTAETAMIRESLRARIAELKAVIDLYDRTMKLLTDDERYILETMYGGTVRRPVQKCMDTLHVERATVYRYRAKAVRHFEHLVTGSFFTS